MLGTVTIPARCPIGHQIANNLDNYSQILSVATAILSQPAALSSGLALVWQRETTLSSPLSLVTSSSRTRSMLVFTPGIFLYSAWHAGPKPSQIFASSVCLPLGLKRSRYSNRTVKYSNKAVSRPDCALPTYLTGYATQATGYWLRFGSKHPKRNEAPNTIS